MDYYVGMLGIFGFQWAPVDFTYCAGGQMTVSQYQALFALIGFSYGGNNSTIFQVPNLCGRKIIGQGQSTASGNYYTMTQHSGAEQIQLGQAQLPTHTHVAHFVSGGGGSAAGVQVSANPGTHSTPAAGDYLASPVAAGDPADAYVTAGSQGTTVALGGVSGGGGTGTVTIDNAGLGQSFSIMNPYLTLNVCICHTGLFPMRP